MGGAWKVAYADFVTAMMALFMVLWISGQNEEIIIQTVKYFKDPFGIGFDDGQSGSASDGSGKVEDQQLKQEQEKSTASLVELALLQKLASQLYQRLNLDSSMMDDNSEDKAFEVTVTPDGLRITIFGKSDAPLFVLKTDQFTEWGDFMMRNIAWLIDRNALRIRIDAHTYKGFDTERDAYSPWELSTDRSNAARRSLEMYAMNTNKVFQVSGFADSSPIIGIDPTMTRNERLEISFVIE